VFSVWQPKRHKGVGITGGDGTVCWADLSTSDVETARRFYSDLFGWQIMAGENDPSGYLHIKNGDDFIGGIPPAAHRNPQVPPHWLLYFYMADCNGASAKAKELGGQILLEPMDMPKVGRWSIAKDPQGAVFALFQSAGQHSGSATAS
jgi:predicted enzyme related to lactoylglutathione lyase